MGIRSNIYYNDEVLFEQLITSPIRQHAPPKLAREVLRKLMKINLKLGDGYSFKHLMVRPRRNFAILHSRIEEDRGPDINGLFYFKEESDDKSYGVGLLSISNIKVFNIEKPGADPFVRFGILGASLKTAAARNACTTQIFVLIVANPEYDETLSVSLPRKAIQAPLTVSIKHIRMLADEKLGSIKLDISKLISGQDEVMHYDEPIELKHNTENTARITFDVEWSRYAL